MIRLKGKFLIILSQTTPFQNSAFKWNPSSPLMEELDSFTASDIDNLGLTHHASICWYKIMVTCRVPCDAPAELWCSRGWHWHTPQCYAPLSSFALVHSRSLKKWCCSSNKMEETHLDCPDRDPDNGEQPHGMGWQSLEWSWGGNSQAQEHPWGNTWNIQEVDFGGEMINRIEKEKTFNKIFLELLFVLNYYLTFSMQEIKNTSLKVLSSRNVHKYTHLWAWSRA